MESELLSYLSEKMGCPSGNLIAIPIYNSKDVELRILKNDALGRGQTKAGA